MSTSESVVLNPGTPLALDDELALTARDVEDAADLKPLKRLSHQSVVKHFDASADVDGDAPEMRIAPADPRWELDGEEVLGATAWYRSQAQPVRAALGLH